MKIKCIKNIFGRESLNKGNSVVRQYKRACSAWNSLASSYDSFGIGSYGYMMRIHSGESYLNKMKELRPDYDKIVERARAIYGNKQ